MHGSSITLKWLNRHLCWETSHTQRLSSGMQTLGHRIDFRGGNESKELRTRTYRSVQPSSAIHCDKQLAFQTVQANHSSGHAGNLYKTWSNKRSMLHRIKRLRMTVLQTPRHAVGGTSAGAKCGCAYSLCLQQYFANVQPNVDHPSLSGVYVLTLSEPRKEPV